MCGGNHFGRMMMKFVGVVDQIPRMRHKLSCCNRSIPIHKFFNWFIFVWHDRSVYARWWRRFHWRHASLVNFLQSIKFHWVSTLSWWHCLKHVGGVEICWNMLNCIWHIVHLHSSEVDDRCFCSPNYNIFRVINFIVQTQIWPPDKL